MRTLSPITEEQELEIALKASELLDGLSATEASIVLDRAKSLALMSAKVQLIDTEFGKHWHKHLSNLKCSRLQNSMDNEVVKDLRRNLENGLNYLMHEEQPGRKTDRPETALLIPRLRQLTRLLNLHLQAHYDATSPASLKEVRELADLLYKFIREY
jgi:hypothetical protein